MYPLTSNFITRIDKDRWDAVITIVDYAADHGIDEALQKFGSLLQQNEREMLKNITPDEMKSLSDTNKKLEGTRQQISTNNNKNNRAGR